MLPHASRRVLVVAGVSLLLLTAGHPKQGAGFAFITRAFEREERNRAAFVMGGVVFEYSEQDWSEHQTSLSDALTETYIRMTFLTGTPGHPEMARGYLYLSNHASDETLTDHWQRLRRNYGNSPALLT